MTGVEACLVPDHHHMNAGRDLSSKLLQEKIDDLNVDVRREHADGVTGSRAGGADDIEPVVACLPDGGESLARSRPPARQRALLAESGFILEVDFYSLAGVFGGDLIQCVREVFLKASWAFGSAFSCAGRGAK